MSTRVAVSFVCEPFVPSKSVYSEDNWFHVPTRELLEVVWANRIDDVASIIRLRINVCVFILVRLGLCRIDIHCDQINLNQNSEQLVDEGTKNHHYVQSAKVEKNITDYTKAFELATGTKSGDYELRFDRKRKFATVKKTDGGVYYVAKFSDLIQDVKDPFTDGPEHVPPTLPGEVTEELYFTTEFLSSLMAAVEERQYTAVSAVCSASAITANPETTFWSCLETVDAGRLYGKAIDFTIKCYPPGNLLRDIACRYIEQGEHYLNQVQDGIFEIVVFNEDTDNQGPFYVYSVDALT